MAKEFNVKDFLQKNKVGPYGLIKENYIDLNPVGAGAPFGGYTQALREDLEEDDIYLGPKKPEPHQIYNTPQGEEEYGDEDNTWMKDVHNEIVGDWQVDYQNTAGILIWTCYNDSTFYAIATPKWDNQPGTPIEVVDVEEGGFFDDDINIIYTEKQDEFDSFEEYAAVIEPILEKYLNAKKKGELQEVQEDLMTKSITRFEVIDHTSKKRGRIVVEYNVNVELSLQDDNKTLKVFLTDKKKGEVQEDLNNGPVGNDQLEEDEDDEHMDRLHAVLDQVAFKRFVKSVTIIAGDLLQDGFDPEDIEDFLVKEIRRRIFPSLNLHRFWQ